MKDPILKLELDRVDLVEDGGGLPRSLIDAIESDGGLWSAGDAYTDASEVVARAREVGARALRLDFRDLSLLEQLPGVRYLHLRSDGMPRLDPVSSLPGLRALIIGTRAIRGELDITAFPDLRWLRASLGGTGGGMVLEGLRRGHPGLEHLSVTEVSSRSIGELVAGLPRLRHARIHFADHLRSVGTVDAVAGRLRGLDLDFTGIRSLDGMESLEGLEAFRLLGGQVTDITPLASLSRLRHAQLETGLGVSSLAPLRGHPRLRILAISLVGDGDLAPLGTMPELVAVGRGPRLVGHPPFPDLFDLARDHPLRQEWRRAIGG